MHGERSLQNPLNLTLEEEEGLALCRRAGIWESLCHSQKFSLLSGS